jgi:hypothetical protein
LAAASGEPMTLVLACGTWTGTTVQVDDEAFFPLRLRLAGFGNGERVVIRVESEPEAKRHHQLRWYYGYIVKQLCENGESEKEWDERLRGECLPPDVETLSAMTYEQMDAFNLRCEQYAAEVVGVVIQGPDEARQFVAA